MSYCVHAPYMYCLDLHVPVLYMYVSTVDLVVDLVGRPILVGTDPAVQVLSNSAHIRFLALTDRARPGRPKGARTAGARSPSSRHLTKGDMVTSESDPSSIAAYATSLRYIFKPGALLDLSWTLSSPHPRRRTRIRSCIHLPLRACPSHGASITPLRSPTFTCSTH